MMPVSGSRGVQEEPTQTHLKRDVSDAMSRIQQRMRAWEDAQKPMRFVQGCEAIRTQVMQRRLLVIGEEQNRRFLIQQQYRQERGQASERYRAAEHKRAERQTQWTAAQQSLISAAEAAKWRVRRQEEQDYLPVLAAYLQLHREQQRITPIPRLSGDLRSSSERSDYGPPSDEGEECAEGFLKFRPPNTESRSSSKPPSVLT